MNIIQSDEYIRAAAERLLDPKDYSDDPMDDAHELAKAWLHEHRDDFEPLTNEWLESVGFEEVGYWTYERHYYKKPVSIRCYAREGRRWAYSMFVCDDYHIDREIGRSDVRRLCAALGVQLGGTGG